MCVIIYSFILSLGSGLSMQGMMHHDVYKAYIDFANYYSQYWVVLRLIWVFYLFIIL